MAKKTKKRAFKKDKDPVGSTLFVAFLLLGIGIGLYFGRPDVGVLVGLGVGFIAKAICLSKKK